MNNIMDIDVHEYINKKVNEFTFFTFTPLELKCMTCKVLEHLVTVLYYNEIPKFYRIHYVILFPCNFYEVGIYDEYSINDMSFNQYMKEKIENQMSNSFLNVAK